MELKPHGARNSVPADGGLNRTSVELKQEKKQKKVAKAVVLIEPLWNWNQEAEAERVRPHSLNRTFVELKHEIGKDYRQDGKS